MGSKNFSIKCSRDRANHYSSEGKKTSLSSHFRPASSLTCFYIHVLPLLQRFSGSRDTGLKRVNIPISHEFEYKSDRPIFMKASVEHQTVSILNRQSSSMIHSMAIGNALVFFDGPKTVQKGDMVETILI